MLHGEGAALAASPVDVFNAPEGVNVAYAGALNLRFFLQSKNTLGLTGLFSMRPVEGELGNYASGALFLFPFKLSAASPDMPAFLPGAGAAHPLIATVAMTPGGLPPDEYFCNYVLKAPSRSFVSFSVGVPLVRGAQKRAWHTNLDNIGGSSIGVGWTSSNLNHRWFAGSRWIPDRGEGKYWRARIVEGLRQVAAVQVSAFGGAVG
jgi:hypothetical protein